MGKGGIDIYYQFFQEGNEDDCFFQMGVKNESIVHH